MIYETGGGLLLWYRVFLLCQGNESANLCVERKCVVNLNKIPWRWADFMTNTSCMAEVAWN